MHLPPARIHALYGISCVDELSIDDLLVAIHDVSNPSTRRHGIILSEKRLQEQKEHAAFEFHFPGSLNGKKIELPRNVREDLAFAVNGLCSDIDSSVRFQ